MKIKFIIALIIAVLVSFSYLGTDLYLTKKENKEYISKIKDKDSEIKNLNYKILNEEMKCKATIEGFKIQQEKINESKNSTNSVLNTLTKIKSPGVVNNEKPKNEIVTDVIPDDVIRLLSDHCKRIRGSECPNP